jgi:hypothetical protein
MSQIWLLSAITLGPLTLGLAAVYTRRAKGRGLMRDVLLLGFAPALAVIAMLELVVVPTWGAEAATSLAPASYVCIILPASILATRVRRHRDAN